jgi:hypothetical protein
LDQTTIDLRESSVVFIGSLRIRIEQAPDAELLVDVSEVPVVVISLSYPDKGYDD